MAEFLEINRDYLLFIQGLVVVVSGLFIHSLTRYGKDSSWRWLALFAFARGLHIWVEVLRVAGPISAALLDILQPLFLTFAGLFLVEFARLHGAASRRIRVERWIYFPILILGLTLAALTHQDPARIADSVTAIGAFGAAAALLASFRTEPVLAGRLSLLFSAAAFFVAATTVAFSHNLSSTTPEGSPAAPFLKNTPFNLGLLALAVLVVSRIRSASSDGRNGIALRRYAACAAAIVLLLAAGGITAGIVGKNKDSSMRADVLARSKLAAATVNPAHLQELHWDERDLKNPAYTALKELMISLAHANSDLRFALLAGIRDKHCYFLADSEAPTSKDYSPPGQAYEEADAQYVRGMASGRAFVLGPVTDRWGTWIIGSVPVVNLGTDKGAINLELDISGANWNAQIRRERLPVILITLLVSLLTITSFGAHERIRSQMSDLIVSEQRNTSLIEGSQDCVLTLDPSGRFLSGNRNGLQALGIAPDKLAGRPFSELWPAAARPLVANAIRANATGEHVRFDADYVRSDGSAITWHVTSSPVHDDAGLLRYIVCICIDMTERKRAERALLAAKEAAEAATRAKSDFLAVMSHEIRTPLGGLIGLIDILKNAPLQPGQRRHAELAAEAAESLLKILDDVLDTAKVESGMLKLESIPFSPASDFMRVLEGMRIRADAKDIEFIWTFSPSLPRVLIGDPNRLRQVLANLVSNALKFTSEGTIEVNVGGARDGDRWMLHVAVRDSGIGIAPEVQARLFNKFEQADASTTRQFGGTGLGLSIVKGFVERMGGKISLESQPGRGSTFSFTLSLPIGSDQDLPVSQPAAKKLLPVPGQSLRLLCAEDDAINREVIAGLAAQMGHRIEFALNGEQAIAQLKATPFDVVLMDNRMPVMDGFQATAAIRAARDGAFDPQIPIIAVTANASGSYREKCLAAGMNDYLTKPVRATELHDALARATDLLRQRGVPLVNTHNTPPDDTPVPAGMSEAELLAIADFQGTPPENPLAGLSGDALEKIVSLYLEETPARFVEMRAAFVRGDMATIARGAHAIKSNSRYVSADKVATLGAELEKLADAGESPRALATFSLLEQAFADTRDRLHALSARSSQRV